MKCKIYDMGKWVAGDIYAQKWLSIDFFMNGFGEEFAEITFVNGTKIKVKDWRA